MSRIPNTGSRPSIAAGKASVPTIPILHNTATSEPDPIEAFMNPANPISPDQAANETIGHESNNVGQIAGVPRDVGSSLLPTPSAVPLWDAPVPTPSAVPPWGVPLPATSVVVAEEYPRLERLVKLLQVTYLYKYIVKVKNLVQIFHKKTPKSVGIL
jgi:hypothetical protein